MKYTGLRNQIAALRAQLPRSGQTIVITGGIVPTSSERPIAEPVQLDLPLPEPVPSPSRARPRVATPLGPGPPAETAPEPPQGDCEPSQAEGWEARWFRDQRDRRRDQGR